MTGESVQRALGTQQAPSSQLSVQNTRLRRIFSTWICAQSYPEALESTMHISATLGLSIPFLGVWSIWAKAHAYQPNLQAEHQRAAQEITTDRWESRVPEWRPEPSAEAGPAVQSAQHGSMVSLSSLPASSRLSQPRSPSTSSLMDAALACTPLVPHLIWQPSFMLQILLWAEELHWLMLGYTPWMLGTHFESGTPHVSFGVLLPDFPHTLSHLAMPRLSSISITH